MLIVPPSRRPPVMVTIPVALTLSPTSSEPMIWTRPPEMSRMPLAPSASSPRINWLATSILPDYRGQGLATELTRRVLDSIRAEGKSATVRCPVFRSFIERNPEYAAMVDIPGVGRDGRGDV